jgi:hypothetical protein
VASSQEKDIFQNDEFAGGMPRSDVLPEALRKEAGGCEVDIVPEQSLAELPQTQIVIQRVEWCEVVRFPFVRYPAHGFLRYLRCGQLEPGSFGM